VTQDSYDEDVKPTLRVIALPVHVVALLVTLCLSSGVAQAKSFSLQSLTHDVYFQPDGSVRIVESPVYDFDGSFSFARIEVEPRGNGTVRFEQAVSTDGKPAPVSSVDGNAIRIGFQAQNETRGFRFAYTLFGDLDVANDVVQFDRQLLTGSHAETRNYTIRLHAPTANPDPFRVFIFTGRSRIGTLTFNGGVATIQLPVVSEDEFVRVRAFLPTSQFPQAQKTALKDGFAGWLEEVRRETQGFRDASREALDRGGFAPPPPPPPAWLLALPFASVIFIAWSIFTVYQRYGREPQTEEVGRYYREPAEDIPPSAVPYLLTQNNPGSSVLGKAVGATLLDFARRGIVKLEKHRTSGFLGIGAKDETAFSLSERPNLSELTPFERQLYSILNSARGGDETVTPDELRTGFRSNPSLSQAISSLPRDWYESTHGELLDSSASSKTSPWTFGAFIAGAASLFGGFFLLESLTPVGVGLMIAGVLNILLGVVASVALPRWKPDKLLNAKRWSAYKNFLTDFSAMNQAPAEHLKLWDYHFVYASALGVSQKYLENVKRLAEAHPNYYYSPVWIPYYGGITGPGIGNNITGLADQLAAINSLSSIATNLSSLESALNPSSSGSSGGFGGGSSGGSSGGGGSSSAG
jgi:uncharacterized membrane protein